MTEEIKNKYCNNCYFNLGDAENVKCFGKDVKISDDSCSKYSLRTERE